MEESTRSLMILYYNAMIELCNACGVVLKHERLYENLRTFSPSPDSFRVLVKHHGSSLDVLSDKIEKARKKRAEIGRIVGIHTKGLGLYTAEHVFWVDEIAEDFCDLMMCRNEDTDFREKVRDYSEQQLQHIANGKEVVPMDFAAYLNRYAKLVEDRRAGKYKRKKKK